MLAHPSSGGHRRSGDGPQSFWRGGLSLKISPNEYENVAAIFRRQFLSARKVQMNSRERIKTIIAGEAPDRCGFWLGNPHADTWPILHKYFGTETEEALRQKLKDDFRWICPQFFPDAYQDPDGRTMFDAGLDKAMHGQSGPFAECEDVKEVEAFPWPNPHWNDGKGRTISCRVML